MLGFWEVTLVASGWIKLHRKIMENWIYEDFEMQHYWIDLLLLANHKPTKVPYYKDFVTIQTGQHRTSLRKLSVRWGVDKDTVKKILNTFQKDGMITYEIKYNSTVITIVNYRLYQGSDKGITDTDSDTFPDTLSDTVPDTEADTDSTLTRMNKNDKRMNKNEKEKAAPLRDLGGYIIED